jgi:preprotein translocase subunit SecG
MYIILIILLVLVSLCLIGVVLIQSGKGGGLSGAFGLGEGQAVFGSRAGDVLTKATEVFAIAFMVLCIAVTWQSKLADDSLVAGRGTARRSAQRNTPLMSLEEAEELAKATNQVDKAPGVTNALVTPVLEGIKKEEDSAESTGNTTPDAGSGQ